VPLLWFLICKEIEILFKLNIFLMLVLLIYSNRSFWRSNMTFFKPPKQTDANLVEDALKKLDAISDNLKKVASIKGQADSINKGLEVIQKYKQPILQTISKQEEPEYEHRTPSNR